MYGHRARIGYTSPPIVTEVFPYEFYKMAPPGVTLALTTLMVARHSAESGEAQESWNHAVRATREMAHAKVDIIVFGGGPVNYSGGSQRVHDTMQALQQEFGIPVTNSTTAYHQADATLGARVVGSVTYASAPGKQRTPAQRAFYRSRQDHTGGPGSSAGVPFIEVGAIPSEVPLQLRPGAQAGTPRDRHPPPGLPPLGHRSRDRNARAGARRQRRSGKPGHPVVGAAHPGHRRPHRRVRQALAGALARGIVRVHASDFPPPHPLGEGRGEGARREQPVVKGGEREPQGHWGAALTRPSDPHPAFGHPLPEGEGWIWDGTRPPSPRGRGVEFGRNEATLSRRMPDCGMPLAAVWLDYQRSSNPERSDWSGRLDLNQRLHGPEPCALPG